MSQAFVKESDSDQLLHQIKPTIPALVNYIKIENNNAPIFVKKITKSDGIELVCMSNGLSYFINNNNNWELYL
jgi:hypothetical protein